MATQRTAGQLVKKIPSGWKRGAVGRVRGGKNLRSEVRRKFECRSLSTRVPRHALSARFERGKSRPGRFVSLLPNLDALRECGAKDGIGGSFGARFTKEFHLAIAMTEPDFLGACREKQNLFLTQLAPCIAWRDNFNADLGSLREADLSTLRSTPLFGSPGDINSFDSLSR